MDEQLGGKKKRKGISEFRPREAQKKGVIWGKSEDSSRRRNDDFEMGQKRLDS